MRLRGELELFKKILTTIGLFFAVGLLMGATANVPSYFEIKFIPDYVLDKVFNSTTNSLSVNIVGSSYVQGYNASVDSLITTTGASDVTIYFILENADTLVSSKWFVGCRTASVTMYKVGDGTNISTNLITLEPGTTYSSEDRVYGVRVIGSGPGTVLIGALGDSADVRP